MPLQNFVDKVTTVTAAWLNQVDALKFTIFADSSTKAQARTALTSDAPLEITNGGTGNRTGPGQISLSAVDSGAANAYVLTFTPNPTLAAGMTAIFTPLNTNTGASTINGVAVISVVGAPLVGGELSSSGPVIVRYTGTQWQILTSAGARPGYERSAAELAAAVTPTNYSYPELIGLAGAQRFGADITGAVDATTALQNWANGCGGVMVFPPNATFLVSAQISIPAGTIIYGNGSLLNAAAAWSTTGWHMLNAKGSLTIQNLNFTASAVARNTSWKAVTCDNSVQVLAANTRLVVRECVITNLDVGVYCDGGVSAHIAYAEVAGCIVTINTLGTGGAASIRPTCNLNNCVEAVIRNNPLLDSSDRVNSVNNIYCIGAVKLTVQDNYVLSGTIKCLSNSALAVDSFTLRGNRLQGLTWVQCQVDTNPIKYVEITGNHFDAPVTQGVDTACVIFANLSNCASVSYPFVHVAGNYFSSVPFSCYYIAPSATNSFGAIILEGNHYDDTSTGSVGSNAVVNFTTGGAAYKSLIAANESVYGNSHTRSYMQAAAYTAGNPFTLVQLSSIEETGITAAKTGAVIKTCTLTITGCITSPTVTATYTIRDGVVTMTVPSVNATSNTTALTLSGLPSECVPVAATSQASVTGADNGAFTNNITAQVQPASTVITFAKNGSTTGFTAAGAKGPSNFTMSWPLG